MAQRTALIAGIAVIAVVVLAAAFLATRGGQPATTPVSPTGTQPAATTPQQATTPQETAPQQTQTMQQPAAGGLQGTIEIGALLPLTGDLASYGENSKAALELAQEDINKFLEKAGAPFRIKIVIEDTETKPDVALQKLQALAQKGIKIFIGPMTSAEVKQLKGYADQNKLLIISQSSTAPSLAIPDDYIFRFCPTDRIQGPVIAKIARDFGKQAIVIMWRGDAWGDGLHDAVKEAAQKLGIEVVDGPRYAPDAKEFAGEVDKLANIVQELVNKYGADKVAVVYIGFNEVVQVMSTAAQYDVLGQVMWFGSDGTALLAELLEDPAAAEFAAKVKFLNPIFAATKSQKMEDIVKRLQERLGREPDTYALAAYDAAWVVTLSLLATQKYDATAVKNILADVAYNYFGATGWIVLDKAGDRAFADYNLYVVVKEDGQYKWKLAGTYHYASDSFTWYINIQ
ncbi:MAG: ABC transporter substrate-binding protein [Crenarchaeota archaeon]|nr:ABC transporter substrate-binding protein [Thermoproteota archaeon]